MPSHHRTFSRSCGWLVLASCRFLLLQVAVHGLLQYKTSGRSSFLAVGRASSSASCIILYMGNGKKKKKKKGSSSSSPSPDNDSHTHAPRRVSNQINIPIKQQIKWAQANKEAARNAQQASYRKPKQRTAYRRSWTQEQVNEAATKRQGHGQPLNWDVILNATHVAAPLVLVDGYNVIYQWARLKKHMGKGDLQRARQLLVEDLENLRTIKGWRIEVVFDGGGGAKRSNNNNHIASGAQSPTILASDAAASKQVSKYGVRQVFTGRGVEADSYIQQRCMDAKEITQGKMTAQLIVVSNDGMIQMAGQTAGAWCMRSDRLIDELKATKSIIASSVRTTTERLNQQEARNRRQRDDNDDENDSIQSLGGTGLLRSPYSHNTVLIEDKQKRKQDRLAQQQKEQQEMEEFARSILANNNATTDNSWMFKVPNVTKVIKKSNDHG